MSVNENTVKHSGWMIRYVILPTLLMPLYLALAWIGGTKLVIGWLVVQSALIFALAGIVRRRIPCLPSWISVNEWGFAAVTYLQLKLSAIMMCWFAALWVAITGRPTLPGWLRYYHSSDWPVWGDDTYMVDKPRWLRALFWQCRNPAFTSGEEIFGINYDHARKMYLADCCDGVWHQSDNLGYQTAVANLPESCWELRGHPFGPWMYIHWGYNMWPRGIDGSVGTGRRSIAFDFKIGGLRHSD